jgi:hypothetical protein
VFRTVLIDSDKRSAQVERLEVVDTGWRRRWSEDEKLKIVLESLQGSRRRRDDMGFRARCCCDGAGGFALSRRMPPIRKRASYRRWWHRNRGRRPVQSGRLAARRSRSSLPPVPGCGSSTRRRQRSRRRQVDDQDDSHSVGRAGMDCHRPHRYASRHELASMTNGREKVSSGPEMLLYEVALSFAINTGPGGLRSFL